MITVDEFARRCIAAGVTLPADKAAALLEVVHGALVETQNAAYERAAQAAEDHRLPQGIPVDGVDMSREASLVEAIRSIRALKTPQEGTTPDA